MSRRTTRIREGKMKRRLENVQTMGFGRERRFLSFSLSLVSDIHLSLLSSFFSREKNALFSSRPLVNGAPFVPNCFARPIYDCAREPKCSYFPIVVWKEATKWRSWGRWQRRWRLSEIFNSDPSRDWKFAKATLTTDPKYHFPIIPSPFPPILIVSLYQSIE